MTASLDPVVTFTSLNVVLKQPLEAGHIWQVRYDNYLQFLSEIENRRETFKKVIKRK